MKKNLDTVLLVVLVGLASFALMRVFNGAGLA